MAFLIDRTQSNYNIDRIILAVTKIHRGREGDQGQAGLGDAILRPRMQQHDPRSDHRIWPQFVKDSFHRIHIGCANASLFNQELPGQVDRFLPIVYRLASPHGSRMKELVKLKNRIRRIRRYRHKISFVSSKTAEDKQYKYQRARRLNVRKYTSLFEVVGLERVQ